MNRSYSEPDGRPPWSDGLELAVVGDVPAARVLVSGELDLLTAPRLNTLLIELLDRGYRQVSVDASGVGFLAAAGLNVLCEATRRYRDAGGRLLLVALAPHLRRLLAIARIGGGLDLAPCDRAEAASPAATPSDGAGPAPRTPQNGTRPNQPSAHPRSASSTTSRPETRPT